MKKFVALVLSLMLVTGICAAAFAAPAGKTTAEESAFDKKAMVEKVVAKKKAKKAGANYAWLADYLAYLAEDEYQSDALYSLILALDENPDKHLGERELKVGMYGPDVFELQQLLSFFGYELGDSGFFRDGVDGEYGEVTAAAVKALQKILKVKESGNYDAATHKALAEKLVKTGLVFNDEKADKAAAIASKIKDLKK